MLLDLLNKNDEIYIIGHNSIDCDSMFSSYVLSRILNKLGYNTKFTILDDYLYSENDIDIINNYLKEKPIILKRENIKNKKFILVDHNDLNQSIIVNNAVLAIDHHIDTKQIKNCYSIEYTSALLYIYDLFKNIYKFNNYEKDLIAISVITDSEYLTSSRFKNSDKKLYEELNTSINVDEFRNKYFKTTDFNKSIDENIKSNHKLYNIEDVVIDRVIIKAYSKDIKYVDSYLEKLNKKYLNYILIWIEYDSKKTNVYHNNELIKTYDYVLTSSVLIIKDLFLNKDQKLKYVYYNPSDEHGNCILRTLTKLLDKKYDEVKKEINNLAKELNYNTYVEEEVFTKYLNNHGYKEIKFSPLILNDLTLEDGKYAVIVGKDDFCHMIPIIDNTMYDKKDEYRNMKILKIYKAK